MNDEILNTGDAATGRDITTDAFVELSEGGGREAVAMKFGAILAADMGDSPEDDRAFLAGFLDRLFECMWH